MQIKQKAYLTGILDGGQMRRIAGGTMFGPICWWNLPITRIVTTCQYLILPEFSYSGFICIGGENIIQRISRLAGIETTEFERESRAKLAIC